MKKEMPPVEPIEDGMSRADHATATIRDWIIRGMLSPGEPLVEARLARQLGASRVPVREALQRLAEQGFVDHDPGQSARVAQRSARDIVEMYQVRAMLEMLACGLAARRCTDEDAEHLRDCVRRGRSAAERGDWKVVGQANAEFHRRIAELSGNGHLVEQISRFRHRLAWLNDASAEHRGVGAWDEHDAVVDLLQRGDVEGAEMAGRQHVEGATAIFMDRYLAGLITL